MVTIIDNYCIHLLGMLVYVLTIQFLPE